VRGGKRNLPFLEMQRVSTIFPSYKLERVCDIGGTYVSNRVDLKAVGMTSLSWIIHQQRSACVSVIGTVGWWHRMKRHHPECGLEEGTRGIVVDQIIVREEVVMDGGDAAAVVGPE